MELKIKHFFTAHSFQADQRWLTFNQRAHTHTHKSNSTTLNLIMLELLWFCRQLERWKKTRTDLLSVSECFRTYSLAIFSFLNWISQSSNQIDIHQSVCAQIQRMHNFHQITSIWLCLIIYERILISTSGFFFSLLMLLLLLLFSWKSNSAKQLILADRQNALDRRPFSIIRYKILCINFSSFLYL